MNKKIAIFLPNLFGGGAEKIMINLAHGLIENGYNVHFVLSKHEGDFSSELDRRVSVYDLKSSRVLYCIPKLFSYFRKERPLVMIASMNHVNIVAIITRIISFVNTKMIVTLHANHKNILTDNEKNTFIKIRRFGMKWLGRIVYPFSDEIIAVSHGVADFYQKHLRLRSNQVKVLYNPVVTRDVFAKAKVPLTHHWFVEGSPPVIIAIGRLSAQKNFADAIKAFVKVREEKEARLLILGEGEERAHLEQIIKDYGLEDEISLPGFVPNPYQYIARSSVFVLSSIYEGLPTVLIESIALGTPVVSTDCPSGPAEILGENGSGRLVPVGDVNGMACCILDAIEKGKDCESISGWDRFEQQNAVRNYISVIEKL